MSGEVPDRPTTIDERRRNPRGFSFSRAMARLSSSCAHLPPALMRSLCDCLERIDAGQATVLDVVLENPRKVLQVRSVPLESCWSSNTRPAIGSRKAGGEVNV